MSKGTHSLDLLMASKLPRELPPVVVMFGDDAFLRLQTIHHLLNWPISIGDSQDI